MLSPLNFRGSSFKIWKITKCLPVPTIFSYFGIVCGKWNVGRTTVTTSNECMKAQFFPEIENNEEELRIFLSFSLYYLSFLWNFYPHRTKKKKRLYCFCYRWSCSWLMILLLWFYITHMDHILSVDWMPKRFIIFLIFHFSRIDGIDNIWQLIISGISFPLPLFWIYENGFECTLF